VKRRFLCLAALACLFLAGSLAAQTAPALVTASGLVEKADKDSLTVRPRGPDGRFGKSIVLKLTGTSKVTIVTEQKRGGKATLVQRDAEAKDLQKNQAVAVIYATGPAGTVLLSAVALPEPGK
jgi:hypothetical protein